jgi:branched-subunit amino acid transport protein
VEHRRSEASISTTSGKSHEPIAIDSVCRKGPLLTFWLTLAGMVVVTFGSRYAGLAHQADLPAFWLRFLHFVPIAVFAALVTPSLEGNRNEWGIRVAAAAVAALAAWRTRQLWVAIAVGMAVFWLLRVPF